jgi:hypothetical protein
MFPAQDIHRVLCRHLEPLFDDISEDQSRKPAVSSQKGEMVAIGLNPLSDHAEWGNVSFIEPDQICFIWHQQTLPCESTFLAIPHASRKVIAECWVAVKGIPAAIKVFSDSYSSCAEQYHLKRE